jgi:hypothetical protein
MMIEIGPQLGDLLRECAVLMVLAAALYWLGR